MSPIPLLLLSDAPTSGTGLGRITCDLATRIADSLAGVFDVATLGYGGPYSRQLPFHQYNMDMKDWVIHNLPEVWGDFAGDRKGVIMTIWDASRLLWFARPESCSDSRVKKFLTDGPFDIWGYFPMDATGPNDKLTMILKHTIEGYDRVLAYSKWAEDILRRTLWKKPLLESLTNLPHGIDTKTFYPRPREEARFSFGERMGMRSQTGKWLRIPDGIFSVGIVATNQARKDFGLAARAIQELSKEQQVLTWIHTDELERYWSIPALLNDYNLKNHLVTTIALTDEQMAWAYSALDVTLGIGLGEGFGYPIFESLACGVPCVHGNYGGATEHMPIEMIVRSDSDRLEGVYNGFRPVFDHKFWAARANSLRGNKATLPEHLDWTNLWPRWEEWFRKGAECLSH